MRKIVWAGPFTRRPLLSPGFGFSSGFGCSMVGFQSRAVGVEHAVGVFMQNPLGQLASMGIPGWSPKVLSNRPRKQARRRREGDGRSLRQALVSLEPMRFERAFWLIQRQLLAINWPEIPSTER